VAPDSFALVFPVVLVVVAFVVAPVVAVAFADARPRGALLMTAWRLLEGQDEPMP